jgi:predicted permease
MNLLQDLRFAIRLLVKDRWFTATAATALALGIGVNATVFTFVNAVLIRGLPFDRPEQIVWLGSRDARGRDSGVSIKDFEDIRGASKSFSELALWGNYNVNLSEDDRAPEQFTGVYMTSTFMKVIGQRPVLGRDFTAEDDQPASPPTVIISHGLWKNRYGSSTAAIGRVLKINDQMMTVIGVMPEGFQFPTGVDLWMPFAQLAPGFRSEKRDVRTFSGIGRLNDSVSMTQAAAELATIGAGLQTQYPDTNKGIGPLIMNFNERFTGGPIRTVFLALMGAVAFVLLIACANVANLLLARSAHRAREISLRVAVGASRWRIVRQLLIESVLLAVVAGLFGLALAYVGVRLFDAATQDVGKPYWMVFSIDMSVFAFFAAVCLLTGVLFGLAPALHVSKTDLNDVLKEGGRGNAGGVRARRWTGALIVIELALTLVLLAGAGLMMRSFLAMYSMNLGFDTAPLLTMRLTMPDRKYPTPEARRAFFDQIDERLRTVPGVQAGAMATALPLNGAPTRQIQIDGHEPPADATQIPSVTAVFVGPHYWETLNITLAGGRDFDTMDGTPGREHAIINQRFAAMHFGNENPVGRRVRIANEQQGPQTVAPYWVTIVGVAPTIRQRNFQDPLPDPVLYLPLRGETPRTVYLIVRAPRDAAAQTAAVRDMVRRVDPDMPLFNIQTMDGFLARQRWPFRVFGSMFAIFALIALVLAAIGLYAVTAYSVTQRTQEVGIRMALGAEASQVRWLFVRGSLVHLAIGLTIGLAGALGVGTILKSVLVQTGPRDPATLATIVLVLVAVALMASYWPARRATKLDPLKALRYE